MTKTYLKLIVAIVFASNLFAQNIPSYVPKDGLVGWWPFNGNANDESGNGNNGTVNGAKLANDRFSNPNSAFQFNRSSEQSIDITNSPALNKITQLTLSIWYNIQSYNDPSSCCGYNHFINKSDQSNQNQFVFAGNNTGLYFYYDNTNAFQTSTLTPLNQWNNVVLVYEFNGGPTSQCKFYVNGILTDSFPVTKQLVSSDFNLRFGTYGSHSYNTIDGTIDDIGIWNRPLTQEEITALYTSTPPCTNPSAVITSQGNTTFCQGGFVYLNASTGANYTYEWYNNGQLINGATASVYQATVTGNYTVKVTDGACSATSNSVPVIVNQYPSSDVSVSGPTTFCEGGSVTLTALGNGTFKWNNGVTSKSIIVNKPGVYRVEITNNNCTTSSKDYSITVNPNPIAKITPDGPTAFCEGGAVNLVASGGTTYKWNSGILTPSIKVTQTGTYYVNVINSFGCSVYTSYDVNVYPNPKVVITPIPQFILHNNGTIKLSATPAGGTFKGEGVTGTSFNPSNIGLGKKTLYYNYTSTQGCSGSAQLQTIVVDSIGTKCTSYDTVTVTKTINDTVGILKIKFQLTTGIKATQFTSVSVYPNPTSDVLIIDASDVQALNGYRYKMIDISGKTVYNELVRTSKTEISLKTFGKAGVYILHVVDANNTSIETRQIVLE